MIHHENAEIRKLRPYQQLKIPEARDRLVQLGIEHALCPDRHAAGVLVISSAQVSGLQIKATR